MSKLRREGVVHRRDEHGKVICSCGCGRPPGPGRRNWHSQECVDTWMIANSPSYIRQALWRRDRGVCADCGCNAPQEFKKAKENAKELWRYAHWWCRVLKLPMWGVEAKKYVKERLGGWTMGRSTGWDADHRLSVADGGGQCGLENYATLCHPCHKKKTKELHQRIFAKALDKPEEP